MNRRIPIAKLFVAGAAVLICVGAIMNGLYPDSAIDIHLHDTYFVSAYIHVYMVLATILLVFAAAYYLFRKIFRRSMTYWPGLIHFIISFIGLMMIILPIPYQSEGIPTMEPRRYYDYSSRSGLIDFITGVVITVMIAQVIFLLNFIYSLFGKKKTIN
jgi:cytochrome c oxidase subunit 1